jgi:hypothetical protein
MANPEPLRDLVAAELEQLAREAFSPEASAELDRAQADADASSEASADEVDAVACCWCKAIVPRSETYSWRDRSGGWHRQCSDSRACRARVSARRRRPSKAAVALDLEALKRRADARGRR